jgi:hypothetical protein
LFLDHYRFATKIKILLDRDTSDETLAEIKTWTVFWHREGAVEVVAVGNGDKMDDVYKRDVIDEHYRRSRADWVVAVDADEFIFLPPAEEAQPEKASSCHSRWHHLLGHSLANVLVVDYWAVFRHVSEAPIDRRKPALYQRRHGIKEGVPGWKALYQKPAVARTGGAIDGWDYGIHRVVPNSRTRISPAMLMGAHWWLVDYDYALQRMLRNRRDRQGQRNTRLGLTAPRYAELTEESIRQLYEEHLNDPQLF